MKAKRDWTKHPAWFRKCLLCGASPQTQCITAGGDRLWQRVKLNGKVTSIPYHLERMSKPDGTLNGVDDAA